MSTRFSLAVEMVKRLSIVKTLEVDQQRGKKKKNPALAVLLLATPICLTNDTKR